jgi:formate hydrogenlyase subunit 4
MRLAPLVSLGAVLVAASGIPVFRAMPASELLLALFALALARFALGLGGLDAGTPFGGLGSSREMTVGALTEPVLLATALPFILVAGTTAWPSLIHVSLSIGLLNVVRLAAFGGLFLVLVVETGRLPVDNPDTHLELTMIHEAMLLEYSGPALATVSLAVWVKQLVLVALVADMALPWHMGLGPDAIVWTLAKWAALAIALGVAESLTAKLRFFRIPGYLGAAMAFSLSAVVLEVVGVR